MFSFTQNYLTRGFWGDEAWTSLISQLSYVQMLKTTAADFHPPGYYTMIELWYKIFPATEVSTRIVSIIFYFLTIFMVYRLASYVRGHLFGILSAIVVAINPIFFTYAFEARNYTMFAFASVGSIFFLVRLSQAHSRSVPGRIKAHFGSVNFWNVVGVIFFSTLGIYTHYYMFFTLAAQGLYILLFDRKILLKMIGIYAIVGVLYLPWIPFLLGQLKSVGGDYWIGAIDVRTHYEAVLRILSGEHENAFRFWLFGLSILLIIVGLLQHVRHKTFEKPYILIWFWAVIPFILATLPGLSIGGFKFPFRSIFFWRYLIPASVPFAMMIVHAGQKLPKQLFVLSIGGIIVLSLTIDYMTLTRYPYTFKQAYMEKVLPQIASGDKIVTVLPSFAEVLYYRNRLGLDNELVVLSEGLVQFSGKSLLDAYVENGMVRIDDDPTERYFELRPGQRVVKVESQSN